MPRTVLAFADCRLDVAARSLVRAGESVDLPPIVFDCIAYLATHRERAVGRDELVAAVWGKSAITDTMLGKAILAARRAVGDTAEAQTLIRTVPRFGYHFVGAVRAETVDDAVEASAASATERRTTSSSARPSLLVAGAAALAAVAIAVGISLYRRNEAPASAPEVAETASDASAVLPVDVLGGPDDAWLRLGLMDLIANRLRDAGVPVMSSDSVVSLLRRNDSNVDKLRERLVGANPGLKLVETSIVKRGDGWMLHTRVGDREIDASGADPVAAARAGVERLLNVFGKHPPSSAAPSSGNLTLDALMQRTEAARLADYLDVARSLLESAPDDLKKLPEVRLRRAQIELRAGHYDGGRQRLEALLADAPSETDPPLRARILANLCNAESQLGDAAAAIRTCSEAIDLGGASGATEAAAIAYNNRAITHSRQREFDAAEADFARARIAFGKTGDMLAKVRLDGNEASVLMGRGRPAEALPIFERARERFEAFGMPSEAMIAIINEVGANRLLLRAADALAASERGWLLLPRVQDPALKTYFRRERAEALAANGRLAEAHALLEGVVAELDPAHDATLLGLVRASEASIELDAGQPAVASVLAHEAVAALNDPENEQTRAEAARNEILALHALGRDAEATGAVAKLAAWSATAKEHSAALQGELAAANLALTPADADAHFERALALADPDLPYLVATAAVAWAEALIARGELERAAIVAGRVSRYVETDYESALLSARLYRALGERDAWQAALAHARSLAGERRIPPQVADFEAAAKIAAVPVALGTMPER
jgi:DNA-binding winged helix-turn-helix (wHTH) protein